MLSFFQTPHSDPWNHQRSKRRFPSGHGEAGFTLWRKSVKCASPFLYQRENHHHPVSSLTPGLWHLNLFKGDILGTVLMQLDWLSDPNRGFPTQISASLVFIIHHWMLKKSLLALKVGFREFWIQHPCSFHYMCVLFVVTGVNHNMCLTTSVFNQIATFLWVSIDKIKCIFDVLWFIFITNMNKLWAYLNDSIKCDLKKLWPVIIWFITRTVSSYSAHGTKLKIGCYSSRKYGRVKEKQYYRYY